MVENALDYEGLKRYDEKSKSYVDDKISSLNSAKIDKTTVASSSTLGLVKSGTDISVDSNGNVSVNDNSHKHTVSNISDLTASASELNIMDGVTATTTELNYVDGVTSNIQTQLNSKQPNITGGATTITSSNLTASRALISNSSGKVAVSDVTSTELGYLDGVTSNIQTQLDAKAPIASPTLTGTPKAPTASVGTNNTQIATTGFVQTAISNLVDSAPETLNTLNELSAALGDDPNFATTVANRIGNTESNITKIIDGTTTVGKALKDADGNVITETYATKEEIENIPTSSGGDIADTVTGKNVTTTDSTDAPIISLKEKGYTEQFTTTGKNLLKNTATTKTVNGITFTVKEDGSITVNGTATGTADIYVNGSYGGTNKILKIDSGSFIAKGTGIASIKQYIIKNSNILASSLEGKNITFNTTDNINAVFYRVENGTTISNFTLYPMIRNAEITDATYEPYTNGASPNPEYPQEIKALDKVSVKTTGKNIFGGLALENKIVGVVSGATKNEETGYVSFSGSDIEDHILFNDFKENTQYTFIFYGKNLGSYKALNICIYYTDGTRNLMAFHSTDISHCVLVSAVEKTVEKLEGVFQDSTTLLYPNQCGIFEGVVTVDDFEPYKETVAEFDLTEPLYEGDYIEYRADGTGVLHRKMAKVVFDGSDDEYWDYDISNSIILFFARLSNECAEMYTGKECCTHYQTAKVYWTYASDKTCGFIKDFKNNFCILDSSYSNLASFKTWLQSNPVTVVYELATPQEIELTAEQLAQFKNLRTFESVTNVLCDGETVTCYYKNSDNGECVAGLQEKIANVVDGTTTVGKATTASKAGTATYSTNSGTSTYSSNSAKATSATSATYATTATSAGSASKATSATSATYASTANYAKSAPTYKGATTAASGTTGFVPAATTATRTAFLRGDGTWATPSNATSASMLSINNTESKSVGGLQFFQKSGSTALNPDSGWWSLLRTQHPGYANGYWQEIAYAFGSDTIKFRRNTNGTTSAWKTLAFTDSDITGTASKATSATSATYASTSTKAGTSTYATNSGTSTYSSNSAKASSATSATYASTATKAGTATRATNADTSTYATNAGSASKATSATSATYATTATKAGTATYASSAPTYKGATTAASGTKGLVPAATTATRTAFLRGDGTWATPTNTQNTAGASNTSSKIFLVGATTQTANPQTYTHDTAYVGTDGCVYSNSKKTLTTNSVLSTVAQCEASTNNEDIAGASAIVSLQEKINYRIAVIELTSSNQGMFGSTEYEFLSNTSLVRSAISQQGIQASKIKGSFVVGIKTSSNSLFHATEIDFGVLLYYINKSASHTGASESFELCKGYSGSGGGSYNVIMTIALVVQM